MSFSVQIPVPPSVNNLFLTTKAGKRVKTPEYRAWLKEASWTIFASVLAVNRVNGPYKVLISLPRGTPGDIDNRIKAAIDALVASGRVDDDKYVEEVTIRRSSPSDTAWLHVGACR